MYSCTLQVDWRCSENKCEGAVEPDTGPSMQDTGKKYHVQKSVNELIRNLIGKSNTIKNQKYKNANLSVENSRESREGQTQNGDKGWRLALLRRHWKIEKLMSQVQSLSEEEGKHGHPFKRVVWTSAAAGSASSLQVSLMRVTNKGRRDEKTRKWILQRTRTVTLKLLLSGDKVFWIFWQNLNNHYCCLSFRTLQSLFMLQQP